MKKSRFFILRKTFFLVAIITCTIEINAQTWYETAEERIDTLRKGDFTLQIADELGNPYVDTVIIELSKHEFRWGNTVGIPNETSDWKWQQSALLKYYNYGVVEHFKWPYMESTEGNINYSNVDSSYAWAKRVGWDLRAHTLIWGGSQNWQMPGWTLSASKTAEEVYDACETHIRREVNRYKGTIKEYDVVNEPVHEKWLSDKVGDSINWNSFIWAGEEDPEARLFINDYNIIVWGSTQEYINKIQQLLNKGAPVNGIGVQGHMEGTLNWQDIKSKLDAVATLGIPIKVTEFDMKIDEQKTSDEAMARYYAMMMRICFSHPAVEGLVWWGFKDPTYRNGSGIFNENRSPKIAADTVYNLIHKKWSTHLGGKTATDGTIPFRGFFGEYNIRVKVGDDWQIVPVSCLKINDGNEIAVDLNDAVFEAPKMVSANHNEDGTVVNITFDRNMQDPSVGVSAFNVISSAGIPIVSANLSEIDSTVIELILQSPIHYNTYYALTTMPGNVWSKNGAQISYDGPIGIINSIPGFVSANTNEEGNEVEVSLSEAISDPSSSLGDFKVYVNNLEVTISSVSYKTGYDSIFIITLTESVNSSDIVKVSYERGTLTGESGFLMDSFIKQNVENRVPVSVMVNVNDNLIVYPNPFKDKLIIESPGDRKFELLILYDQTGKVIFQKEINTSEITQIKTSDLIPGFYVLKLFDEAGNIYQMKIIKE